MELVAVVKVAGAGFPFKSQWLLAPKSQLYDIGQVMVPVVFTENVCVGVDVHCICRDDGEIVKVGSGLRI